MSDLKSGIDTSSIDPSVRLQDDLFRHFNGKWLKESVIPEDRSSDGVFMVLRNEAEAQVRAIIESASGSPEAQKNSWRGSPYGSASALCAAEKGRHQAKEGLAAMCVRQATWPCGGGGVHGKAFALEPGAQRFPKGGFIFHQQNTHVVSLDGSGCEGQISTVAGRRPNRWTTSFLFLCDADWKRCQQIFSATSWLRAV